MNIQIKIEIDKELTQAVQSTFDKVAEKIIGFVTLFEKISVKTEDEKDESNPVPIRKKDEAEEIAKDEKKSFSGESSEKTGKTVEPEKTKAVKARKKQKSKTGRSTTNVKKKITVLETVFDAIKKNNSGITVEDLKKETGFEAK
ncbi:MAG: hypothetical protein HQK61_12110, partial [Desulfamplus sp.]|nr:hypothetical protein [Desulfamplus sp.]